MVSRRLRINICFSVLVYLTNSIVRLIIGRPLYINNITCGSVSLNLCYTSNERIVSLKWSSIKYYIKSTRRILPQTMHIVCFEIQYRRKKILYILL